MALTPMLFIGLGGTGGKVLGVIQNSIRTRLQAAGILELPEAWQFLHVDVAAVRDAGDADFDLRPSDFQGLTRDGTTYGLQYEHLHGSIREADVRRVVLDSWAPRANETAADVTLGAGQLRAIGRVVALSNLETLYDSVRDRLQRAKAAATRGELAELCEQLGLADIGAVNNKPMVVVVSSVAGGSGAGLTADLLDLLSPLDVDAPLVNVFTPEIFDELPPAQQESTAANGFYALMELVSLAWDDGKAGYQTSRHQLFPARQVPVEPGRGGAYSYYLIGLAAQSGSVFTKANEVYLVMGRLYAELAFDQSLLTKIRSHVQTNHGAVGQQTPVNLIPRAGTGIDDANLLGIGFARLTVGRDFFHRYAHQRLTNLVTTQLLEAHLSDPASRGLLSNDELLARSVELHYPSFVRDVQLQELDTVNAMAADDVLNLLTVRGSEPFKERMDGFKAEIVSGVQSQARRLLLVERISSASAAAVTHQMCATATSSATSDSEYLTDLRGLARAELHSALPEAERSIEARLGKTVPHTCAEVGLPVTISMLDRLEQELLQAGQQLQNQSSTHLANAQTLLRGLEFPDSSAPRSFPASDYATIDEFAAEAESVVTGFINADERNVAAGFTRDIALNVIHPWREALEGALDSLSQAANRRVGDSTLRATWPTETGAVPDPLRPSGVEFSLDDVADFPQDFKKQILVRMPQAEDERRDAVEIHEQAAIRDAVRDIITGMKDKLTNGARHRVQWTRSAVSITQRSWVSELRGNVKPQPLSVRVRFGLHDLEGRINEWLIDPREATYPYLNCTLRGYLDPTSDSVSDTELRRRHERMVALFDAFLRAAQPLLRLNLTLLDKIHRKNAHDSDLLVGELDVPELGAQRLTQLGIISLRTRLTAVAQQRGHGQISFTGGPSPSVTAFSVSASPVHPLTVASLMEPVVKSPSALEPSGSRHRRSRPLPESVPLSPAVQRQLLVGLYAARMLGEAEFNQACPAMLKVRVNGSWVTLPVPGVRPANPLIPYMDLPGRFLESYLPSLVQSFRETSLTPVEPYRVLAELGSTCLNHQSPLAAWIRQGNDLPASADDFHVSSATGPRREVVKACLADFSASLDRLVEKSRQFDDTRSLPTLEVIEIAKGALEDLEIRVPPENEARN